MELNKTKVRYILRQNRKGVATEEIARDVKVSQRRGRQIIKEYIEAGQEPVLGEKIGRPRKPYIEKEAKVLTAAYARYLFLLSFSYLYRVIVFFFSASMIDAGAAPASIGSTYKGAPEAASIELCFRASRRY
jgi:hypothetical protein